MERPLLRKVHRSVILLIRMNAARLRCATNLARWIRMYFCIVIAATLRDCKRIRSLRPRKNRCMSMVANSLLLTLQRPSLPLASAGLCWICLLSFAALLRLLRPCQSFCKAKTSQRLISTLRTILLILYLIWMRAAAAFWADMRLRTKNPLACDCIFVSAARLRGYITLCRYIIRW